VIQRSAIKKSENEEGKANSLDSSMLNKTNKKFDAVKNKNNSLLLNTAHNRQPTANSIFDTEPTTRKSKDSS